MSRSLENKLRRWDARAEGKEIAIEDQVINNYNLNTNQVSNNNIPPRSNKTHKNYKGLYLQIHTDRFLKLAQEWGMHPGLLYGLCRDYGVSLVRECIIRVDSIGANYFKQGQPLGPQRGRYCRATILNEARKRE